MKTVILCLAIAVLVSVTLSGCPNILPTNGNTLVVHNNSVATATASASTITTLSIVRVPDECSNDTPEGVNLLPVALVPGKTFSVEGLSDGRYYCSAPYTFHQTNPDVLNDLNSRAGYVTLVGNVTQDWYVFPAQASK